MGTYRDIFCEMIRERSRENRAAMKRLAPTHGMISPAFSILRQELDSMVRVIYLLSISDTIERQRLIRATLEGQAWRIRTPKGSLRKVTDREMVDLAQGLQGWTLSVYRFGCAFIHLSDFHNHLVQNPFERLAEDEKKTVLSHMRYYHAGPSSNEPSVEELAAYIPMVFDKIADNLECYLASLERDKGTEAS